MHRLLLVLGGILAFSQVQAQKRLNLTGPRWGVTVLVGEISEDSILGKTAEDIIGELPAAISQFGVHFEHRLLSGAGVDGVIEFIALAGGMDRGVILPSLSLPVGVRATSGWEVGFGPNYSLEGLGYVIAMGKTFEYGDICFPFNVSIVLHENGQRISLLTGYGIKGRR
jgi:hypothetical protein